MGSLSAKAELRSETRPGALAYLWLWFLELHSHRGAGAMGPAPITWPDLDAWARRTRRDPLPWEIDMLSRLDDVFFLAASPAPKETK